MKPYRVTKGNTDGCLHKGDLIWISKNGILNRATAPSGFLMPDELNDEILDFEAEVDSKYEIFVTAYAEGVRKREESDERSNGTYQKVTHDQERCFP